MERNILHGPKPQYSKPEVPLGVYLYDKLVEHGSRIAMIDAVTEEQITYDELLTKSLSVAHYLTTLGVKTGDVVAISSENSLYFLVPVLAAYYIGASCSTLSPAYTTKELHHVLKISKPCVVFCSENVVDNIDSLAEELSFIRHIVVFGLPHSHRQIPFTNLLQDKSRTFQPLDIDYSNATAAILYSSGTTGLPKGVMITQNNVLTLLSYMRDPNYITITPSDVLLGLLPMFHAYGFFCAHISIAIGFQIIIMKKFEEQLFLKTIKNYKITLLYLVPPLVLFLAKHPLVDKYNFSSVREVCCASAPLSAEVQAMVIKRLGIGQIRQMFGMTETTFVVLLMPPEASCTGSTGTLAPGFSCKVVDVETGKLLGPREKGELHFKGPLVMKGYIGDEQATTMAFDDDGFLYTGDVGYYDEDGFFYIIDRIKEIIKYKAFQVSPAELEAILLAHPAVKDAGVVGKPDEVAGELPMAFVVKQISKDVTEEQLIQFVADVNGVRVGHVADSDTIRDAIYRTLYCWRNQILDQMSPQKWLRGGVKFVDSIPKSPSGKIL